MSMQEQEFTTIPRIQVTHTRAILIVFIVCNHVVNASIVIVIIARSKRKD